MFVVGYFTYPLVKMIFTHPKNKPKKINHVEQSIEDFKGLIPNKASKIKQKSYHLEPKYHGYGGEYDLITKCDDCTMIALYEDQHPSKPCNFCGGNVVPFGAAKWMEIDGELQWNKKLKK